VLLVGTPTRQLEELRPAALWAVVGPAEIIQIDVCPEMIGANRPVELDSSVTPHHTGALIEEVETLTRRGALGALDEFRRMNDEWRRGWAAWPATGSPFTGTADDGGGPLLPAMHLGNGRRQHALILLSVLRVLSRASFSDLKVRPLGTACPTPSPPS